MAIKSQHHLKRCIIAVAITFVFAFFVNRVFADTQIEAGEVSGEWTIEGSPYIVLGDIVVKENETLVIKPGVEVRFARSKQLLIGSSERLIAEGTKDAMIIFTSNKANSSPGDWGGISLGVGGYGVMKYCLVEYATTGIEVKARNRWCDSYHNDSKITNCVIRYNSRLGIFCDSEGGAGCAFPDGSLLPPVALCRPTIQFNLITENGSGISCRSLDGILFSGGYVSARICGNIITANKGDGIVCYGDDDMIANIICNNIIGNDGSGIKFGDNFWKTSLIANNIIAQNSIGINSTAGIVPDCQFNDVWNNGVNYEGLPSGNGDISKDPLFVDIANEDYRLRDDSPCIDAGENDVPRRDFNGCLRPIDGNGDGNSIIDMGAYEYIPLTAVQVFNVQASSNSLPADGKVTAIITATAEDACGNPLSGQNVGMAVSQGQGTLSDVEDNGDGTYTSIYTASNQPGTETITVTVGEVPKTVDIILTSPVAKRTLSVTSVEVLPGAKAIVQISITDATGLAAGDILVKYDADFITIGEIKGTDLISGINLIPNTSVLGEITLSMAGAQGIPSGSGDLVEVELIVSQDAEAGTEITMEFADTKIYDESGAVIPVDLKSGVVKIADERTLRLTSLEACPSAHTTVQFSINDAAGVAGGDILIKYDTNVITVDEVKGTDLISGMTLIVNKDVSGEIKLSIAGAQEIPSGNGTLIEIELTVNTNAKIDTETTLKFGDTEIYDVSGTVIPIAFENGVVKITECCTKGDVYNDGKIGARDAILVFQIAEGLVEPTDYQKCAADVNCDGKIGANDAIQILRVAAGLLEPFILKCDVSVNSASPNIQPLTSIVREITVMLAEAHGLAGEVVTVPLKVSNIDGLAGGDIQVAYDNSVLQAVDVSSDANVLLASNIAEPGIVRISFASIKSLNSETVAEIQFDILTNDISPLILQKVKLYQSDAHPINSRKINGQFSSGAILPTHSALFQNFPNPFNPETWIPYQLRESGEVIIRIYSVSGKLVRKLDLGYRAAGFYLGRTSAGYWDGYNDAGEKCASGVYFYQIKTGEFLAMRRMVIVK